MLILLAGTSGIGLRHARNILRHAPGARFVAVRSEHGAATRELDATLVPDLAAGLKLRPQAAVVALPPAMHAAAAREILAARVPLYLEKPVALRSAELAEIAAEAEAAGTVTMAGCNLRRLGAFRILRNALAEGQLGRVTSARLSVGQWLPDWRPGRDYRQTYSAQADLGGGVTRDLIHEIDLARFLFGEFDEVRAVARTSEVLELGVEDHAEILLLRQGLMVSIHLDYLDRAACRQGRVVGSGGTAAYDLQAQRLERYDPARREWVAMTQPGCFDGASSLENAMIHFLDCLRTGRQTEQPISDSLRSVALMEAARKAAGLSP